MLQRRVRQENSQPWDSRRYRIGNAALRAPPRQDNRSRVCLEQCLFFAGQIADCARGIEIANHDRERLAIAVLAFAQAHDCGLVRRVHGEMKSADAFDGDDLAREQQVDGLFDWLVRGRV